MKNHVVNTNYVPLIGCKEEIIFNLTGPEVIFALAKGQRQIGSLLHPSIHASIIKGETRLTIIGWEKLDKAIFTPCSVELR